ncbi:MAG: LysM peptidoglycan-binding domain-containing protein, partial [Marinirhabdus sp.]
MKYFTYMLFACVLSTGCGSAQLAQSPNTLHTVNEGETIYSISKKYGVSREAIYKQNPAAKSGIQVNSVLVIPTGGKETVTKDNPPFILHKVKRRQTLFSISKKYGISQDEIKKYNKALYARQVKKDETLRIPRIEKIAVAPPEDKTETTGENPTGKATHTVKPKETLFGIAHNYGITIAELQALNPGLDPSLPIGSKLNVPAPSTEVEVIDPDRFSFYVVRPKEGFFRLKVKLGLSEEAIVSLNPFAKEGLKEGMVLKIPKAAAGGAIGEIRSVSLENRIRNRDNKNLAVLLPFRLNKTTGDSVSNNQNIIKNDALMRIALDFY